jgi:tetratricopeptide (TPR) repeat protein
MASTARLDELKKKFDENPRRYFAPLANEHRKSGDLDQAIALCRAHLPQQPAHISGHIVLAQALFEAGSLDEAREIFHTALGLDPENLIALRYLGDIARDANDVDTARTWYQRVLEVDPRNDEIVQMVRDLDAPHSAVPAAETPVSAAAAPVVELSVAVPPTPSAPVADNPRFAPISMDSLELDEHVEAPANDASDTAASTTDAAADVPAWSQESPTLELPALDTPGIDPFDMDPAASADALLELTADAEPAEDFFLAELAAAQDTISDFDVAEPTGTDPWAVATPQSEPATASGEEVDAAFEEGAFYTEPASATPTAEMSSHAEAHIEARVEPHVVEELVAEAQDDVDSLDAADFELPEAPHAAGPEHVPDTLASIAVFERHDAETSREQSEPNANFAVGADDLEVGSSFEELAAQPTAEWHAADASAAEPAASPVTSGASNDLGLEVMEFVPPSSEMSVPLEGIEGIVADSDPLVGRTPEFAPSTQDATPPAFVTETMAELYLQQGFRNEALAVYRELLARNPGDVSLRERVEQVESGSMSSLGMANVSESVVESALRRQSTRPSKSVRSFFASLAGRRAPQPPVRDEPVAIEADQPAHDAFEPAAEAESAAEPVVADPVRFDDVVHDHAAPTSSAAEVLAAFDPFADASEPAPDALGANTADDVFGMEGLPALPNAEPPAAQWTAPAPAAAPEPTASSEPPRRTLEDLFPDAPVTPRSEVAAQTLATAFGRTEPQGRPTRAANSELSLDKVFRGAPEGAPPSDGGFSFDQFFSDPRPSNGGDVAAPTMSMPETGRSSAAAGDSHDIEQFTAWLEGLKKK